MSAYPIRVTVCSVSLILFPATAYVPVAWAQSIGAEVTAGDATAASAQLAQQDNQAPTYAPPQLDQLLAPIALYPDFLLAQILMASTYPLEVVDAARWVQDPNNARLQGDPLDAALQPQTWDPSVKSLVPFPQVLQMMNSKLDWTQALGNAFLAQQADVMDSVQRLRSEARAAGTLQSTPQETVSTQGQVVAIAPANPQLVYVPYYDPTTVYGSWGYPDDPPFYFPPPPNYVAGPGIYFGVGLGIVGALWGWDRWDWGHHDIDVDPDRFNRINNYAIAHDNRPRDTENTWQHDPAHRRGVPYSTPAVRQKFQPAAARSPDARRDFRGFDNGGSAPGSTNRATPSPRGAAPAGERRTGAAGANADANHGAAPTPALRPADTAGREPANKQRRAKDLRRVASAPARRGAPDKQLRQPGQLQGSRTPRPRRPCSTRLP